MKAGRFFGVFGSIGLALFFAVAVLKLPAAVAGREPSQLYEGTRASSVVEFSECFCSWLDHFQHTESAARVWPVGNLTLAAGLTSNLWAAVSMSILARILLRLSQTRWNTFR